MFVFGMEKKWWMVIIVLILAIIGYYSMFVVEPPMFMALKERDFGVLCNGDGTCELERGETVENCPDCGAVIGGGGAGEIGGGKKVDPGTGVDDCITPGGCDEEVDLTDHEYLTECLLAFDGLGSDSDCLQITESYNGCIDCCNVKVPLGGEPARRAFCKNACLDMGEIYKESSGETDCEFSPQDGYDEVISSCWEGLDDSVPEGGFDDETECINWWLGLGTNCRDCCFSLEPEHGPLIVADCVGYCELNEGFGMGHSCYDWN